MQNRHAIADWVIKTLNKRESKFILDYGGGFGTIACLISEHDKTYLLEIYEPHPTKMAIEKVGRFTNISFVNSINKKYDCLISTDVLEHVPDPLMLFADMISATRVGGYLLIANCFYPVIKCHLPSTFHLRFTFDLFAKLMRLENLGVCQGSHATIFRKTQDIPLNWRMIRGFEHLSKFTFPILEVVRQLKLTMKRLIR